MPKVANIKYVLIHTIDNIVTNDIYLFRKVLIEIEK